MAQAKSVKAALVTGGAKRIGRAIARDLAAHGWSVCVHARTSSHGEAERTVAEIRDAGGQAQALFADLSDVSQLNGLVEAARSAFGAPLTLLVNNASLFEKDSVGSLTPELFDAHHAVHVRAPCFLAQAMAARLPDGMTGSIVNMVDQRVWKPTPEFFSYTLSKSALWAATRTLAQALAPRIRVNAIGPGPTLPNTRQTEDDFRRQTDNLLLGHGPALAEFGRTIRFLAETPSVTGQMIALDGGQHLAWQTPDVTGMPE
ncbi:SDR family oxidoreductase [Breoghania sp. L-A4]|uniref:SDR family oxidoreductase n=1 Tax=Breoghania sp. L-A4 TaxID=2304600 RepID=UPI000E3599A3|nr:SDR family oxidoreductase [Breoghania sp. L-A4]AXS41431.1 SDR family oxidoreductase [Breoghania sp. L-A4]